MKSRSFSSQPSKPTPNCRARRCRYESHPLRRGLLLFLRKYPLDPSSIKQVFAKLKSGLGKAEAETVDAVAQCLAPARPRSASLTQDIRKGQDTP